MYAEPHHWTRRYWLYESEADASAGVRERVKEFTCDRIAPSILIEYEANRETPSFAIEGADIATLTATRIIYDRFRYVERGVVRLCYVRR